MRLIGTPTKATVRPLRGSSSCRFNPTCHLAADPLSVAVVVSGITSGCRYTVISKVTESYKAHIFGLRLLRYCEVRCILHVRSDTSLCCAKYTGVDLLEVPDWSFVKNYLSFF